MKNQAVDIIEECAALFNQEDMLAWFDFQLTCREGHAAPGLCRIGHPKKSTGGKEYVSLVFVTDTPDAPEREQVIDRFMQLGSGALETMLPELVAVVSVPPASIAPQMYIKQYDLILKEKFTASPDFIAQRLYPALKEALSLNAGELGWWEDMQKETSSPAQPGGVEKQPPRSFIARLREKLFPG